MRKGLGVAVLVIGTALLGWWAKDHQALGMQSLILDGAKAAVAGSVHGVTVSVSGRDVQLAGITDSRTEAQDLVAAVQRVPGVRVLTQDLRVLDRAAPFLLTVRKTQSGLEASGNVPTEAVRHALALVLGDQADRLVLASGAPKEWRDLATAGLASLDALTRGQIVLTGSTLAITGEALGPAEAAKIDDALANLNDGTVKRNITLLDDGTPAVFTLDYAAAGGARLDGKLPHGVTVADLTRTTGLPAIAGAPRVGVLGQARSAAPFAALKPWFGRVETLKLTAGPDGRVVVITVQPGVDIQAMQAALSGAGFDAVIKIEQPKGSLGDRRINAATGKEQRLVAGLWMAVPEFAAGPDSCKTAADEVLAKGRITFISGSDALDPTAVGVIDALANVLLHCAQDGGLRAEIGGYTDSSGDAMANLGLSQRRASAVRLQLVARGVPGAALRAVGHGDADPVADNTSEAGRAANRRTTITWSRAGQ